MRPGWFSDFNPAAPPSARTSIENLLVVTFTEAAAAEMKSRIAAALQKKRAAIAGNASSTGRDWLSRQAALIDRAAISTLHAFCARLLRQYFHQANIDPAFEIIDQDEARLLREEVLDERLARWHALGDSDAGRAFADFLETYGRGKESNCRDLILSLHDMLATVADPAQFKAAARRAYAGGAEGAAATLDAFCRQTLASRCDVAAQFAARAGDQASLFAQANPSATPLLQKITAAHAQILKARSELWNRGPAGWGAAQTALNAKLDVLKSPRDLPGYHELKERTWDPLDRQLRSLREKLAGDPEKLLADLLALSRPLETFFSLADDFSSAYAAAKRSQNRLDFADLERLALDLLRSPDGIAAGELRRRFHHVLVDEFQDINPLQEAILEALRNPAAFGGRGNLFAVGDVKQSIYSFRHAEPGLFLQREQAARESRPAGGGAGARSVGGYLALPHNFRSHPELLAAMNAIFSRLLTTDVAGIDYENGHRLEPGPPSPAQEAAAHGPQPPRSVPIEMHLVAINADEEGDAGDSPDAGPTEGGAGAESELKENLSAYDHEARMVAERIAALLAEKPLVTDRDGTMRPLACRDIAILLRSVKNRAMIFVRALARRGIPVHADLSTGFFDSPEIRDVLALLHLLDNQDQDIPLAAALLGPFGHFSHDDLARIRIAFRDRDTPFYRAAMQYAAGEMAAAESAANRETAADLSVRLREFFERMDRWRNLFRTQPLHEALAAIFSESKLFIYLSALEAGEQRIANVHMLAHRALGFSSFRRQGLHRFLRFIERLSKDDHDTGEAAVLSEASDVVRIMSVHKSKGLEFPLVFVSGLGGQFNRGKSGPVMIHRHLGVGLAVIDHEAAAEYPSAALERIGDEERRLQTAEELRLLYVAMTRARERLFLTGHIAGSEVLETCREEWGDHAGPLPEDQLLRAPGPLQWLLPAMYSGAANGGDGEGIRVSWNGESPGVQTQIAVSVHSAGGASESEDAAGAPHHPASKSPDDSRSAASILSPAAALSESPAAAELIARITAVYPFAHRAQQPAVQTVTFLKTQPAAGEEDDLPAVPVAALARPFARDTADASRTLAARQRGIATHRVLELLDFSACDSPAALDAEIQRLRALRRLSPAETAAADLAGIRWFLLESEAGRRLRTATSKVAAGDHSTKIFRELPFTWTPRETQNPKPNTQNLADIPTIRGVIDLLLIQPPPTGTADAHPIAEILDYKTDSEFTWQSSLDDYRRQMHYYLTAASDILGFPVRSATLIFLSPREQITVSA